MHRNKSWESTISSCDFFNVHAKFWKAWFVTKWLTLNFNFATPLRTRKQHRNKSWDSTISSCAFSTFMLSSERHDLWLNGWLLQFDKDSPIDDNFYWFLIKMHWLSEIANSIVLKIRSQPFSHKVTICRTQHEHIREASFLEQIANSIVLKNQESTI